MNNDEIVKEYELDVEYLNMLSPQMIVNYISTTAYNAAVDARADERKNALPIVSDRMTTQEEKKKARLTKTLNSSEKKKAGGLADMLTEGFEWEFTPQGYDYWRSVCNNLRDLSI